MSHVGQSPELKLVHEKGKAKSNSKDAGEVFTKELLPFFPPVLHEWFVETFSEPSLWLASRTAYSRTAAVMSMVGYILGSVLGSCCISGRILNAS